MSKAHVVYATNFTVKGATVSAKDRKAIVRKVKSELIDKATGKQSKSHKLTRDKTASGSGEIGFAEPKRA